jgi:hypothetical protein
MKLPVLVLVAAVILMTDGPLRAEPATQPDGTATLVDATKAATAQVVVRGVLEADPAGPPKGGWPTYMLVISQVFKTPEDVKIAIGQKLTVKTVKDIKGPVTLYLVFDKDQKLYRLQDPLGERGFSHVGAAATTTQPAAKTVAFDVHGGYFVSNKFEPKEPASFVVISDQKAFDRTFGVAFVMGDKSHRLPANAFDSKIVVAAIKRGKAMWQFTVQDVQAGQGILTIRYTVMAKPQESAEFACPLIVSVPKGSYTTIRFIENEKLAKEIGGATSKPSTEPAARPASTTGPSAIGLGKLLGLGIRLTAVCGGKWPRGGEVVRRCGGSGKGYGNENTPETISGVSRW